MLILKLHDYINRNFIASDHLSSTELSGYIDKTIDNINDRLNTSFPVLAEWADYVEAYNTTNVGSEGFVPLNPEDYTAIPNRYLRSVVAPGTAVAFYTNDEEGEQTAARFFIEYEQSLGYMIRDYIFEVPEEFQNNTGGFVDSDLGIINKGVESYGNFFL